MKLGLVFTLGMSAEQWHKQGLLSREMALYERLLNDRFLEKVTWFTYGSNENKIRSLVHPHIKIVSMPPYFVGRMGRFLYSFLMPFIRGKFFQELDVIKSNQMRGSWTALIAARRFKKIFYLRTGFTWSLLVPFHSQKTLMDRVASLIERFSYRYADTASVTSVYQKNFVQEKYKVDASRIQVVPNFIDTGLFKPNKEIKKKENRIIFVGRLHSEKNLFNLIKALAGLPYELDMYYGSDPLKKDLEKTAQQAGSSIRFLGHVPNEKLPAILNQYEVFVLPSHRENMPKALLEAMACGLCVLGSHVQGINEVVEHARTGWLVGTDSDSIRGGIKKLMTDKPLRQKLGMNAYTQMREGYSLEAVINKEKDVYKNMIRKASYP